MSKTEIKKNASTSKEAANAGDWTNFGTGLEDHFKRQVKQVTDQPRQNKIIPPSTINVSMPDYDVIIKQKQEYKPIENNVVYPVADFKFNLIPQKETPQQVDIQQLNQSLKQVPSSERSQLITKQIQKTTCSDLKQVLQNVHDDVEKLKIIQNVQLVDIAKNGHILKTEFKTENAKKRYEKVVMKNSDF